MQSLHQIFEDAQDHHANGELAEAVALYRKALQIDPNHAHCLYFLGLACCQLGQAQEGLESIRRAIVIDPTVPEYHGDLAAILFATNDLSGAISAASKAIELRADFPEALFVLGNSFCKSGQFDQGIDAYQRVLALRGDAHDAINNLGMTLFQLGRIQEAVACFDRVLAINPTDAAAHSNRIYAMHFSPAISQSEIRAELVRFNRIHAEPLKKEIAPHHNSRVVDRPLRIGYVSADFREHVVGWNLLSWLPEHDASRFKTYCYSSVQTTDEVTRQLQARSFCWRDIARLSDAQVADMIREDQIDILVDLSLHTSGNRLLVFARKPAPVQITYLAYPGSSGLETMDYRLSDPVLGSNSNDFSEKTICLPKSYWCYRPGGPTPDVVAPPALSSGTITFGCLNQFQKVSDETLDTWQQIMQKVGNSRLLLHAPAGRTRARVVERFERVGIAGHRVEFVGRLPWAQYIQLYQQIDIALDPFPYCGGITSCDGLWMGVPMITLKGNSPIQRSGASILQNLNLAQFVAVSNIGYVQAASSLAIDFTELEKIRKFLRQRMMVSSLMKGPHFARDMEAVYLEMWRQWASPISA